MKQLKKNDGGRSDNTVRKIFKVRKVICDCGSLCKLEKGTGGVLVLRQGKPCLQHLKESWPGGELTITGHPLKPGQGTPLHVEGDDGQPIVLERSMVFKELVDLKDPTKGFGTIKLWDIKFQAVRVRGGTQVEWYWTRKVKERKSQVGLVCGSIRRVSRSWCVLFQSRISDGL